MNKLKIKVQVRNEIHKLPNLDDYQQDMVTPQADAAMIRYLLDSIAWLDSLEED
jgi:hypothetical protein